MTARAIHGGTVIDGNGGAPIKDGVVLIDDSRIAKVGRKGSVDIPAGAELIDATGATVMPGVIDTHIHIHPNQDVPNDVRIHLRVGFNAINTLRLSLARGVTTVVSITGGPPAAELVTAIEEGYVSPVARMIAAGVVNASGGHVRGRHADGPWEVRKAVRELISAGCRVIKTAASGGFQWEHERVWWPDYTAEELEALVDEARSKDTPVAVHAHSQPGLDNAIRARAHMIHHGALIDEKALDGILENDLYYVPTLYITSRRHIAKNPPPWTKERMENAHPIHRAGVRRAHEMGVKIAVGTDGGPGDAMFEMGQLVECGLSPMDAIVAGTRNAADALGRLEEVGTLEPGKRADVLIVDGNPLEDIGILDQEDRIALVMQAGRVHVTNDLFRGHIETRPSGPPRRVVQVTL